MGAAAATKRRASADNGAAAANKKRSSDEETGQPLQITIRALSGAADVVEARSTDSIHSVKESIQKRLGHHPRCQALVLGNAVLNDDAAVLQTLGIRDGSELSLLLREDWEAKNTCGRRPNSRRIIEWKSELFHNGACVWSEAATQQEYRGALFGWTINARLDKDDLVVTRTYTSHRQHGSGTVERISLKELSRKEDEGLVNTASADSACD
mmetsp:Transcript_12781/g.30243  ORF Transcript_12781/g.30243 Transcript_12781/m.30243 type:complete len:211 (-) Transcript_12781:141-773(-)